MKQPKTAEMLIADMEKTGSVELAVHPEHFDEIKKMFDDTQETNDVYDKLHEHIDKLKREASLKGDEVALAAKKAWLRVDDSFDSTMRAVQKASGGAEIDLDRKVLTFKSHDVIKEVLMKRAKREAKDFISKMFGR